MKKTLSSAYEQILESEHSKLQNPSHDTVGNINSKQDFFGEKPKTVEGSDTAKSAGAEKVAEGPKHKVDVGSSSKPQATKSSFKGAAPAKTAKIEDADEVEEDEVSAEKEEKEEKQEKTKNENFTMSAFENLFKKTINEEIYDTEESSDTEEVTPEIMDTDVSEEPNSEEELEDTGDLMSDLKSLQNHLADIISKLEDVAQDEESEESEEYSEQDFEQEFEPEDESEELKEESAKASVLSNETGKKRISLKNNKAGKITPKSGKAHSGDVSDDPEPKALKDDSKKLQKVKGKPEPKSTIKKGEFFK